MSRHRHIRVPFTEEDDIAMWRFLLERIRASDRDAIEFPKGHNIWKKAELRQLCDGRKFTNLQSRFTRYLLPNLDESELSWEEINELKTAWRIPIKRARSSSTDGGNATVSATKSRRVIFDEFDTDSDVPRTSSSSRLASLRNNKESDEKRKESKEDSSEEFVLFRTKTSLILPQARRYLSDVYTDESSPARRADKESETIVEDSSVSSDNQQLAKEVKVINVILSRVDDREQTDEANGSSECYHSPVALTVNIDDEEVQRINSLSPPAPSTSNADYRSTVSDRVQPFASGQMDEQYQESQILSEQSSILNTTALFDEEARDSADLQCSPLHDEHSEETRNEENRTTPVDESLQSVRESGESGEPRMSISGGLLDTRLLPVEAAETAAAIAEEEHEDEHEGAELEKQPCERSAPESSGESLEAAAQEGKRLDISQPKGAIHHLLNREIDVTPWRKGCDGQEATLGELQGFDSQDFKTNVIRLLRDGRLDPRKLPAQIAEATRLIDRARTRISNWRNTTLTEACALPD
uniref:Rap1 Myb domain-containing protein n=1 Tax=Plectus sambesii TaxID=2011161 RepID=A0A914VBX7_9BILA